VEIYPELSRGKYSMDWRYASHYSTSLPPIVSFEVGKPPTTAEAVNEALQKASLEGPLKGILWYETKPLVSTDYTNDTRS